MRVTDAYGPGGQNSLPLRAQACRLSWKGRPWQWVYSSVVWCLWQIFLVHQVIPPKTEVGCCPASPFFAEDFQVGRRGLMLHGRQHATPVCFALVGAEFGSTGGCQLSALRSWAPHCVVFRSPVQRRLYELTSMDGSHLDPLLLWWSRNGDSLSDSVMPAPSVVDILLARAFVVLAFVFLWCGEQTSGQAQCRRPLPATSWIGLLFKRGYLFVYLFS